jgi:prepilin-type N-terminal cleavage/methylation domain-containing protein/prepilin-type processing-associated H-X9-DG protein
MAPSFTRSIDWLRPRPGMTLIELLAVIAIIGLLVALLLPAVQGSREAARRSQCVGKLRQIALALTGYHDARRAFPPGALQDATACQGPDTPRRASWTVWILPHLEEAQLYDRFNPTSPATRFAPLLLQTSAAEGTSTNIAGQNTPLPIFKCPSDPAPRSSDPSTNYFGVQGGGTEGSAFCQAGSVSNYRLRFSNGILCAVAKTSDGIPASRITDGLSKTFLIGESRWWSYGYTNVGFGNWFGWSSSNRLGVSDQPIVLAAAVDPINNPLVDYDASRPWADGSGNFTNTVWLGTHTRCFGSRHPGGCHMALADGAVQFFADGISTTIYRQLGTRSDSLPTGAFP